MSRKKKKQLWKNIAIGKVEMTGSIFIRLLQVVNGRKNLHRVILLGLNFPFQGKKSKVAVPSKYGECGRRETYKDSFQCIQSPSKNVPEAPAEAVLASPPLRFTPLHPPLASPPASLAWTPGTVRVSFCPASLYNHGAAMQVTPRAPR